MHSAAPAGEQDAGYWNAYWSVPHLTGEQSTALVTSMNTAAAQRAPFAGTGIWSALRYWKTKATVVTSLAVLTWMGELWPGVALILCGILRLNRRTCYVLAAIYVAEAVLLSATTITNPRYQGVWIMFDTTLAAAPPTVVLLWATAWIRNLRAHPRSILAIQLDKGR
jgi:hypothetical protein